MATECFRPRKFGAESLLRISQCNKIIEIYLASGLRLTLRQLYYQFVSKALIPNEEKSYRKLGSLVSNGRLAGLIDWDAIEDRMRQPETPAEFEDLNELLSAALNSYRLPRLCGQDVYAELWVEKDALAGVLQPLAQKYHATLMVNRGYSSQSAMYESAQRIQAGIEDAGASESVVFYLGDLDPSGEDMVRDISDRLSMFGVDVDVRKVALTMAQVNQYTPPPNPTKLTDSRASGFIKKFGRSSWEVDALPPNVLHTLIDDAFTSVLDMDVMNEIIEREETDMLMLRDALDQVREDLE